MLVANLYPDCTAREAKERLRQRERVRGAYPVGYVLSGGKYRPFYRGTDAALLMMDMKDGRKPARRLK